MLKSGDHDRSNVKGPDSYHSGLIKTEPPQFNPDLKEATYIGNRVPIRAYDDVKGIVGYASRIEEVIRSTQVKQYAFKEDVSLNDALEEMHRIFKETTENGHKIILIGNGGSSAIASHVAIDYCKNGGLRAVSLNDFPTLTCLSNDFGYNQVFAKQIEYHAVKDDCLVAISTGGNSANIRNAVGAYVSLGGNKDFIFTGMKPENPLRGASARFSFYVPSFDYGIVEIAHLTLLHSLCRCTI